MALTQNNSEFAFEVKSKDKKTKARSGVVKTPHGDILTPAFSPIATRASVRTLDPIDIKNTGSQVVLGNTYHLYLRPGERVIKSFGGFAPFMNWDGPTITDSGGYQVSFFRGKPAKITDRGASFSSYVDGSKHMITPEKSMEIQSILAADIIMAFDQPLGKSAKGKNKEAFARTLKWEERSLKAWQKNNRKSIQGKYQALFGIVQGETDEKLRRESLQFVLSMDFPGIAMGGETIGSDPKITAETLDTVSDLLPENKPLHALGLGGGPEGLFEAVERGVDLFDNTGITRMARAGILFTYPEDGGKREKKFREDVNKAKYIGDKKPFSKICKCLMCQNFSAGYIHHLFAAEEILGLRLATIHNITFINDLMTNIRKSIYDNNFLDFKKEFIG